VAAGGDGIPASDTTTAAEAATSLVMSEEDAGDPTALTSLTAGAPSPPPQMATATASAGADDNAVEEPEVIMGHPGLRAPGAVSLSEAMGMTHFMLNQVHDVLRRKREDISEERRCLFMWVSLLNKRTTSKKEKAEVR
jgi:hypothetical protein